MGKLQQLFLEAKTGKRTTAGETPVMFCLLLLLFSSGCWPQRGSPKCRTWDLTRQHHRWVQEIKGSRSNLDSSPDEENFNEQNEIWFAFIFKST